MDSEILRILITKYLDQDPINEKAGQSQPIIDLLATANRKRGHFCEVSRLTFEYSTAIIQQNFQSGVMKRAGFESRKRLVTRVQNGPDKMEVLSGVLGR